VIEWNWGFDMNGFILSPFAGTLQGRIHK